MEVEAGETGKEVVVVEGIVVVVGVIRVEVITAGGAEVMVAEAEEDAAPDVGKIVCCDCESIVLTTIGVDVGCPNPQYW